MKKFSLISLVSFLFISPLFAHAQATIIQDKAEVVKAQVVHITKEENRIIPGTDTPGTFQTIQAKILEGTQTGKVVTFTDDYLNLAKGEIFYLNHTTEGQSGIEMYGEMDVYRIPTILLFTFIFVALVLLIGGIQGLRGLLSLIGSLLLITFVLLPGILHGYPPVLVSIAVSSVIIVLGSYITHGFNKTTSSAVLGMIITVLFTAGLAFWAVHMGKFTGQGSDEAVYLILNSRGHIDVIGILLGGIMIGVLGVLYDVSIGQAISVEELHHIAPHIPRSKIYTRAIRIGREHIGALVNTLAIAYVGASLPLLLLFYQTDSSISQVMSREVFASEIIRTLVGSIGLVMAVPITTFLAVIMLVKVQKTNDTEVIHKEAEALKHAEHHH
ncbi:MAG: hypothetical protein JWN50_527 [Parcubacteria group bacterium]|nr:hypothetical protein [Parcubacteria group bacterium]